MQYLPPHLKHIPAVPWEVKRASDKL